MLKHVQLTTPLRARSDSLSCRSRASTASSGSGSGTSSNGSTTSSSSTITSSSSCSSSSSSSGTSCSSAGVNSNTTASSANITSNAADMTQEVSPRMLSLSLSPSPAMVVTSMTPMHSRTCSYSSLADPLPRATLRIHTACLRQDVAYRTLSVSLECTCREVVSRLLRRCRMRHRDPRLFYLTMEVVARASGARTILALDPDARPAALQACHPTGYSRFSLQVRRGGLVRVHDSALNPDSRYKSLLLSEQTTADELLALLLNCHDSREPVEQFSLYEVCPERQYQRKLHPDDSPLRAQSLWSATGGAGGNNAVNAANVVCAGANNHFVVKRNPDYGSAPPPSIARRKLVAPSCVAAVNQNNDNKSGGVRTDGDCGGIVSSSSAVVAMTTTTTPCHNNKKTFCDVTAAETNNNTTTTKNNNNTGHNNNTLTTSTSTSVTVGSAAAAVHCKICKDSFRSCDYCHHNQRRAPPDCDDTRRKDTKAPLLFGDATKINASSRCYEPVYRLRTISCGERTNTNTANNTSAATNNSSTSSARNLTQQCLRSMRLLSTTERPERRHLLLSSSGNTTATSSISSGPRSLTLLDNCAAAATASTDSVGKRDSTCFYI